MLYNEEFESFFQYASINIVRIIIKIEEYVNSVFTIVIALKWWSMFFAEFS